MEWLSNHLAHDLKTHRNFYRLHEATISIAKVSRLLQAVEDGKVAKFKDKTLDEIQLEGRVHI